MFYFQLTTAILLIPSVLIAFGSFYYCSLNNSSLAHCEAYEDGPFEFYCHCQGTNITDTCQSTIQESGPMIALFILFVELFGLTIVIIDPLFVFNNESTNSKNRLNINYYYNKYYANKATLTTMPRLNFITMNDNNHNNNNELTDSSPTDSNNRVTNSETYSSENNINMTEIETSVIISNDSNIMDDETQTCSVNSKMVRNNPNGKKKDFKIEKVENQNRLLINGKNRLRWIIFCIFLILRIMILLCCIFGILIPFIPNPDCHCKNSKDYFIKYHSSYNLIYNLYIGYQIYSYLMAFIVFTMILFVLKHGCDNYKQKSNINSKNNSKYDQVEQIDT